MFDHYLEGRYGAYRSSDGLSWSQAEVAGPPGIRHASVLDSPIPRSNTYRH
jgi:hypothetical protein